jgi:hypothetical protein
MLPRSSSFGQRSPKIQLVAIRQDSVGEVIMALAGDREVLLAPVSVRVLVPAGKFTVSPLPCMKTRWLPDVAATEIVLGSTVSLACVAATVIDVGKGLMLIPAAGPQVAVGLALSHQEVAGVLLPDVVVADVGGRCVGDFVNCDWMGAGNRPFVAAGIDD